MLDTSSGLSLSLLSADPLVTDYATTPDNLPIEKPPTVHSCESKGLKQMHFWTFPIRQSKFKECCKQRGTTMSEVLNRHMNAYIAESESGNFQ